MGKVISFEKVKSSEMQDLREILDLFDEIIEEAPGEGYPEIAAGMVPIRKELAALFEEHVSM